MICRVLGVMTQELHTQKPRRRQLDWLKANVKGEWTLSMRDDAFGRAVWFAEKKEAALFKLQFG